MTERATKLGLVVTIVGALLPWVSVPQDFDSSIVVYGKSDSYLIVAVGAIALMLQFIPRVKASVRYSTAIWTGLVSALFAFSDYRTIRFVRFYNPTKGVHTNVGVWICILGALFTSVTGLERYFDLIVRPRLRPAQP